MYHVHCQVLLVVLQESGMERRNVVLNKPTSRSAGVEVKMPASFTSCISFMNCREDANYLQSLLNSAEV